MTQIILGTHCPTQKIKDDIMKLLDKINKKTGKGRAHIILEALKEKEG